jgi:ABC-type multidrug transport system fused ATPase/permease subunit
MQFLQPTSGLIEVDGRNIRSWSPEIWRKNISWVGQKPAIFNASLRENIRLFDSSYRDDQVEEALENAMLGRLFHDLPKGLDTPLLESGIRFSSGERQRIAIARAFLKNGSLVVMDEPTSHLDAFLDEEFLNSISKLLQNRLSITIAHHIPLMRNSDEILVMQQGRLVENGAFETLRSTRGTFSNLIRAGEV